MSRKLPWVLFALAAAAAAWLTWETRDLARRLGLAEAAARGAPAAAASGAASASPGVDADAAEVAELRRQVVRLEAELAESVQRSGAIADLVQERIAAEQRLRAEREDARRRANAPMPEGVRLCLLSLHDCLAADGFRGLRFLHARELADGELRQVELLDADPETLVSTLYLADRMTARLDRARGRLELRFHDGHRLVGAERAVFPPEGFPLELVPVSGRVWEERLPFLVRGEGAYPGSEPAPGPTEGQLDTAARLAWMERLNGLLARAGTDGRLQVKHLRGLHEARFTQVSLAGYDQRGLLQFHAAADDLCVEVDVRAGVAQLCLRNGVLHGSGGRSTISAQGYRMLLPDLTPGQATDAMLGMVITR